MDGNLFEVYLAEKTISNARTPLTDAFNHAAYCLQPSLQGYRGPSPSSQTGPILAIPLPKAFIPFDMCGTRKS